MHLSSTNGVDCKLISFLHRLLSNQRITKRSVIETFLVVFLYGVQPRLRNFVQLSFQVPLSARDPACAHALCACNHMQMFIGFRSW